jgi:putative endonuclease
MADERPRANPVQGPVRRPVKAPRQDPSTAPSQEPSKDPKQAPRPERQIAFRTGISAESRAAALLIAKGFRILARRWKSPVGEIDIIARRRSLLVFVEVKARETLDDAAWAVSERQRSRIIAAAEAWLARNADDRIRDIRFDAMLVAPGRIPRHIPAAFDASM